MAVDNPIVLGQPLTEILIQGLQYPEQYWSFPAVISNRIGRAYFAQGGNTLGHETRVDQLVTVDGYWIWHHAGRERLRVAAPAGQSTLSVNVLVTTATAPLPTLRVLPTGPIPFPGLTATAPAVADTLHTLSLDLDLAEQAVLNVELAWLCMAQDKQCRWGPIAIAA